MEPVKGARFTEINERDQWSGVLKPGGRYYYARDRTTFVPFTVGEKMSDATPSQVTLCEPSMSDGAIKMRIVKTLLRKFRGTAWSKCLMALYPGSAPAPPHQGAPGGSGRLSAPPRGRSGHGQGPGPLPRVLEPAASKVTDFCCV